MKIYALIHGVCGTAEGYSETDCFFHWDKASAVKDQSQWLSQYTNEKHDKVIVSAERDEFIIIRNDDECDHVILRIVEIKPLFDGNNISTTAEWFCWNQMDNEPMYEATYLPTDMGLVTASLDWLERDDSINAEMYSEFVRGVYYRSKACIESDDVFVHCYRVPKSSFDSTGNVLRARNTKANEMDIITSSNP